MDMCFAMFAKQIFQYRQVDEATSRHIWNKKKHCDLLSGSARQQTLSNLFKNPAQDKIKDDVTKAELLFTNFLIEHNLPLATADHAGPLFRKMFPDSKIAEKYACARTKTTALNNMLADENTKNLVEKLKLQPFSLSTDGSNDKGATTLYPIVVRYYDESQCKEVTEVLDIVDCGGSSTGEWLILLYYFLDLESIE